MSKPYCKGFDGVEAPKIAYLDIGERTNGDIVYKFVFRHMDEHFPVTVVARLTDLTDDIIARARGIADDISRR